VKDGGEADASPRLDRQGVRERAFSLLAGTVGALFAAFAVLGGAFLWYADSARSVVHVHQVRSAIADVLQNLTDAESAQRGYVVTGDRHFVAEVTSGKRDAEAALNRVEGLTRNNPGQQARIRALREQMAHRVAVLDRVVAARAAANPVASIRIIRQGEGIAAMAQIRRMVDEFDAAERAQETVREAQTATIRLLILLALGAFAVALAALFAKALRDIDLDRAAEATVAKRLRQLVADRTLLLDEVNHRVKNSLQQIVSVVRLQSKSVAHPEAQEALNKTLDRIMAVGRVHEQLYKAGSEVGQFDGGRYAESLARELVDSLARDDVVLVTEVTPAPVDLRHAVPLALILNELITNALKYGCPVGKPCRIRVVFGTEGANYRLSVSDDGPGLPPGAAPKTSKSLGMRAIQALVRQLEGEFIVEQPKLGAHFAVVFPRSPA
jgi:two-component sensor histidine kinase